MFLLFLSLQKLHNYAKTVKGFFKNFFGLDNKSREEDLMTMFPEPYETIGRQLAEHGLSAYLQNADQLVVSCQRGPVWPDRGNSFWLSNQSGVWYLCTWSPIAYRVPSDQDIVKLCMECMKAAKIAMYRVPREIVELFNLHELDELEFENIFPD